eukprot:3527913-Pleurochrysis_carterae.AAC.1
MDRPSERRGGRVRAHRCELGALPAQLDEQRREEAQVVRLHRPSEASRRELATEVAACLHACESARGAARSMHNF